MERTLVKSSNIKSVGYDASAHVMEIAFINDRVYSFAAVPASIYDGIMSASSAGKFFFNSVRGKFVEQEVTPLKQDTLDKDGAPSS